MTDDGRSQPPIMPLGQPPPPRLPRREPPKPDLVLRRRRRRVWLTVVAVPFGFATLVSAAYGSPMAFVFGFVLVVVLGLVLFMFPPTRQR
jgi:hypothetical protein